MWGSEGMGVPFGFTTRSRTAPWDSAKVEARAQCAGEIGGVELLDLVLRVADGLGGTGAGASKEVDLLEKPLRLGGNRDVVYEVGKFFGAKFRPWGAVKTAGYLGKANVVPAAGGVVLDVADLVLSARREKNREVACAKAREFVLDTAQKLRQAILEGSGGPIAYIQANRSDMQRHRDRVRTEILALDEAARADRTRLVKYLRLLHSARECLGLPSLGEQGEREETGRVA